MKGLYAALWSESLKVRKSGMFLIIILIFAFVAFMLGLLVFLAKNPDLVSNSEVISAKARMIGKADWPSYFNLLNVMLSPVHGIDFRCQNKISIIDRY